MAKNCIYPLSIARLEEGLRLLVTNGQNLGGRKAVNPKPAYFLNFRAKKLHQSRSDTSIIIPDRNSKVEMECTVHGTKFIATPRGLFNTSNEYSQTTCKFCERTANVGRNFTTLREAKTKIAESEAFDWTLDEDKLPEDMRDWAGIVESTEELPLRCKRKVWGTNEPCDSTVKHKWNNIQHTLDVNPDHLHCRGACDSTRKGKARRKPVEGIEAALIEKRHDTWRLSNQEDYRKASEPQWFTHSCGNEVFRIPEQILGFPGSYGFSPDTADDCPYCTQDSPLGCLNQSIAHYRLWIEHITVAQIKYEGENFPVAADSGLPFKCICGTAFQATQEAVQKNRHYGCPTCAKDAGTRLRAWILDDAMTIVERRGMILVGDPKSYTDNATIIDRNGTVLPFQTILQLAQTLPAHSSGFGKSPPQSLLQDVNSGKPYTLEDIEFIMENKSTMSYRKMAGLLGRSEGSLKQKFRELDIRNDEREHYKRFLNVWDGAFGVDTPESCYWAGLLATDGTVTDRGEVKICLKAIDEDVLQALAHYLQFQGRLKYRTVPLVEGRGIYVELRFRSNQIRKDLLERFGITQRKTAILPPPSISGPLLIRSYMVGLIEGDGSLRRTRRGELMLNFISAAPELFQWFVRQSSIILGKKLPQHELTDRASTIWSATVHCGDAEKLKEALLTAFQGKMSRKWQI